MNFEEAESDNGDDNFPSPIQEDPPNTCEQAVQTNEEKWDQKMLMQL